MISRFESRIAAVAPLLAIFAASACGSANGKPTSPPRSIATQFIVGIDISGSRTAADLGDSKRFLDALIARVHPGDRLILLEMYQSRAEASRQLDDSIPAPHDPLHLRATERRATEDFRQNLSAVAQTFFDSVRARQIQRTDIFTTLFRSADYARSGHGRHTKIYLLSDMLNATPEVDMEHRGGIPGAQWIAAQRARGTIPDLRGACVVVVGADVSTARGAQLRAFWQQYFAAAGASLAPNAYRNLITDPSEVTCDITP